MLHQQHKDIIKYVMLLQPCSCTKNVLTYQSYLLCE